MDTKMLQLLKQELLNFRYSIKQYQDLESKEIVELLNKIAPEFFGLYQHLSWDYFILSVSRLLDEDKRVISIAKFHKQNRTTLKENEALHVDEQLRELQNEKLKFEEARNNFVGHKSVEAFESEMKLTFSIKEAEAIWSKMVKSLETYDPSIRGYHSMSDLSQGAKALLNHLRTSTLLDDVDRDPLFDRGRTPFSGPHVFP